MEFENTTAQCPTEVIQNAQKVERVLFMLFTVLSILACTFAFILYILVRNIHQVMGEGKRHWIHWNLMGSFILRDTMVLTGFILVTYEFRILEEPGGWLFGIMYVYLTTTSYYWMFVEGLYLFLGLKLHLRLRQLRWLKVKLALIGWVIPGLFVTNWAIEQHVTDGPFIPLPITINASSLIIIGPIYLLLVANLFMLVYVLFTVGNLIRFEHRKRDTVRALAKRTLFLSVILSTHEIIPVIIHLTQPSCTTSYFVYFVSFIIFSNQGLLVAALYVLSNDEVINHAIRHLPGPVQRVIAKILTCNNNRSKLACCCVAGSTNRMLKGSTVSTINGGVSRTSPRTIGRDMQTDDHAFSSYSPSVSSNPSTNNSPLTTPVPSCRTSLASGLDEIGLEDGALSTSTTSNNFLSPGTILHMPPTRAERQSSLDGVLYKETTFTFWSAQQDTSVSVQE